MPYFGVPIRNGLPIGLGTLTALAKAVAVVVPPVSSDPYFEYVSLLLNTNATNGAQNNTFLDGSTNAFSVTRNGNTTQGTFSPFSQTGWSNYFDGTGDYLTLTSNAAFGLGTGDFTIEMWVYATANPANGPGTIFDLRTGVTSTATACRVNSSLNVLFYDGPSNIEINVGTIQLNTWTHIAHVRASGSLKTYINGSLSNTTTVTSDLGTNQPCMIGNNQTAGFAWNGYQSNFRVVKGTAVYTSNFTPPTSPLTNITNTSLLTCQSNRFIDNSSNAFAITRNGDVSVQAFSPFNPTAAWSASTNGGSGYFDGTGDYLSLADNAALNMGSSDFTIESWVYTNSGTIGAIVDKDGASAVSWSQYLLYITPGGKFEAIISTTTTGSPPPTPSARLTGTTTVQTGTWYHVAVTRVGTNATLWVNGVSEATSSTVPATLNTRNQPTTVGTSNNAGTGASFLNGYLSNTRIVKGTAVYTSAFTPPTAPLTAITNTSLLLNFTNAGIYDSASGNDLETVGNAQVSTVQAKWGTTSMAFDGTGDWLTVPDSPTQRFGTGDFTVEFWMYVTGGLPPAGIIGKGTSTTGWEISWQSGRTLRFTFGSTSTTSVATFNNNTWYHVALVRSGSAVGNVKLYLDGTAILTSGTAVTDNLNQTNVMYVGANRTGANAFTGYIDDLRITNGYARYTANFTPPTAAFPLQ